MGSFSIFLGFYGEERVPALGYTKCYQVGCLKEYACLFQYFFEYVKIKIKIQYPNK